MSSGPDGSSFVIWTDPHFRGAERSGIWSNTNAAMYISRGLGVADRRVFSAYYWIVYGWTPFPSINFVEMYCSYILRFISINYLQS